MYVYQHRKELGLCTRCKNVALSNSNLCESCFEKRTTYQRETDPKKLNRDRKRKIVDEIKAVRGCSVCGEKDHIVLDFHHVDPKTKRFTISNGIMRGQPMDELLIEMEKCIILCANDHRRQHNS